MFLLDIKSLLQIQLDLEHGCYLFFRKKILNYRGGPMSMRCLI